MISGEIKSQVVDTPLAKTEGILHSSSKLGFSRFAPLRVRQSPMGKPQDRADSPSRVEASTPVALLWGCPPLAFARFKILIAAFISL